MLCLRLQLATTLWRCHHIDKRTVVGWYARFHLLTSTAFKSLLFYRHVVFLQSSLGFFVSIELAFEEIDGTSGQRLVIFLHGILGRGSNLRSIARQFIAARPDWTAWLVDLRGHGRSIKSGPGPSLEAAARDVANLTDRAKLPFGAIVGHSFGGKVALEAARIGAMPTFGHVVVIDSAPGSREAFRAN